MSRPLVLAIDGGNWKTDLALVQADGRVLALVRGPQSSPHHLGLDGSLLVLGDLLAQALDEAGLPIGGGYQRPRDRHQRFPRNRHFLRLGSGFFVKPLTGGRLGRFVCHNLPAAN